VSEPLTAEEESRIRQMLWEHALAYAKFPTEEGVESWADIAARLLATLDAARDRPGLDVERREAAREWVADHPTSAIRLARDRPGLDVERDAARIAWLEREVRRLAALVGEVPQPYDPDNFPPATPDAARPSGEWFCPGGWKPEQHYETLPINPDALAASREVLP
jgi:hypothetical protein